MWYVYNYAFKAFLVIAVEKVWSYHTASVQSDPLHTQTATKENNRQILWSCERLIIPPGFYLLIYFFLLDTKFMRQLNSQSTFNTFNLKCVSCCQGKASNEHLSE